MRNWKSETIPSGILVIDLLVHIIQWSSECCFKYVTSTIRAHPFLCQFRTLGFQLILFLSVAKDLCNWTQVKGLLMVVDLNVEPHLNKHPGL